MESQQVFTTQDTALATVLSLAGVPPAKTTDGKIVPQVMYYDANTLRGMGYKGMTMKEAATKAKESRKSGLRVYQFERTSKLQAIVEAFKKAQLTLAACDGSNGYAQKLGSDDSPEVSVEDIAAIGCAFNSMRRRLLSNFDCTIMLVTSGQVTTEKIEGVRAGSITRGTFKAIGLTASKELEAEIRI